MAAENVPIQKSLMGAFIAQQLISVFAAPSLLMIEVILGEAMPSSLRKLLFSSIPGAALVVLVFAIVILVGYSSPRSYHRLQLARWTWILPTIGFSFVFSDDWRRFGLLFAYADLFDPDRKQLDGIGLALFTLPTASAIAYSVGAALSYYRVTQKRRASAMHKR